MVMTFPVNRSGVTSPRSHPLRTPHAMINSEKTTQRTTK
jgi:hypothetical protein